MHSAFSQGGRRGSCQGGAWLAGWWVCQAGVGLGGRWVCTGWGPGSSRSQGLQGAAVVFPEELFKSSSVLLQKLLRPLQLGLLLGRQPLQPLDLVPLHIQGVLRAPKRESRSAQGQPAGPAGQPAYLEEECLPLLGDVAVYVIRFHLPFCNKRHEASGAGRKWERDPSLQPWVGTARQCGAGLPAWCYTWL